MYNRPRGTKDLYDEDMKLFEYIEKVAKKVFESANVGRLQTPVFEHTEVFARGVGGDTDIVQKEMYTFLDKSDRSLTLRPEGTAGAVRAYIENGMSSLPSPKKLWYMMPIYRYENVQKGRQREFNQIGLEYFGSAMPEADFEIIYLAIKVLKELGIKGYTLKINSIGNIECRNNFKAKLKEELKDKIDTYCEDCKRRYDTNILRVLDCKVDKDKNANLPSILEYLDEECKKHFERVKELLDEANIKYEIDDKIVRGLDYYNKTVFEILDKSGLAILGGGRYDDLATVLGGNDTPAVGFAIGVERLAEIIKEENIDYMPKNKTIYVIAEDFAKAYNITSTLRDKGILVEQDLLGRSVRASLKQSSKLGFKYSIFVNENNYVFKNMETGEEETFETEDEIIKYAVNA